MFFSINVQGSIENQFVQHLMYIEETPCILLDHSGRIVACNIDFLTLSGYKTEQLAKMNVFADMFIEVTDLDQLKHKLEKLRNKVIEWKGEGQQFVSHLQPFFIPYIDQGQVSHYLYLQFLANRKLPDEVMHAELLTSFSEQLFAHPYFAYILLDNQGQVVRMTESAAEILNGQVADFIGTDIVAYFSSMPTENQLILQSFFDGLCIHNKAVSWKIGSVESELVVNSMPIYNLQDKVIGVSVFMMNVTNNHSLEHQIRRNDRLAMIGQIAAGTAHEIRNPLTSIKGFLQVMRTTLQEHQLSREVSYTDIMLDEIERINQLVGEFLLLSRSKETKYDIFSLKDLMNQFLPILSNEALLNGIEVIHEKLKALPQVIGNKDLLKQVFLNICKNAIEAMGEKGEIRISYDLIPQEKMISINFDDNGPGIPPYVLDKIFDPFFTTKEEGTGLGLAVCHRIIHDMGGKILVTSRSNQTIFHVQIPYIES